MTTLTELQDLLAAHTVNELDDSDPWEVYVNSGGTHVKAAVPAIHPDPADAFAAASSLVDQILELGYKLTRSTISAKSTYQDSGTVAYRGYVDIGLQPTAS